MPRSTQYPKSRQHGILVDQVGDETVVYDAERQTAHSLNRLATLVWRHCDGSSSVQELAAKVGPELGTETDETVVEYALDKLASAHLLEESQNGNGDLVTRREALRKVSFTAAAAVTIPVILSIAAPSPAMAESGGSVPPPDPGPD